MPVDKVSPDISAILASEKIKSFLREVVLKVLEDHLEFSTETLWTPTENSSSSKKQSELFIFSAHTHIFRILYFQSKFTICSSFLKRVI